MNDLHEQGTVSPPPTIPKRICLDCLQPKDQTEFYLKGTGKRSTYCKLCERRSTTSRLAAKRYKFAAEIVSDRMCGCGCGEFTNIAAQTDTKRGIIAGEPRHFINGHATRLSPIEYLEEDRGYKTPCWIWQRSTDKDGYGFITIPKLANGRKSGRAHAVYYEKKFGKIPKGLLPDHLCRVPSCVNPDHLEIVTVAENTQRGKSAKLDWDKVAEIRSLLESGLPQSKIGAIYGVTQGLIGMIKRGKIWKNS